MAESMREMLRTDMRCEGLLECFHDLKALDRKIFAVLQDEPDALTVDDIAGRVDRERSTAYRAVQRLLDAGLLRKEQVNYEQGGYHHVYRSRDGEAIGREMQRLLNDWYAQMGQLIGEFEAKYADDAPPAASPEN